MLVNANASAPPLLASDFETRWNGADGGVVAAWLRGLELRRNQAELVNGRAASFVVAAAEAGELPVLPWKGGVDRPIKATKVGSFLYLAMWHGLRGDDLDLNLGVDASLVCRKHGVHVVFTSDLQRLGKADGQ